VAGIQVAVASRVSCRADGLDGSRAQAQFVGMGTDKKQFSDYDAPPSRRRRLILGGQQFPVPSVWRKPEGEDSKFRVLQLPLPRRRRRTLVKGQPHNNERPIVILKQVAAIFIGLALFVFAVAYFFYNLTPIWNGYHEQSPSVYDPKLVQTNVTSVSPR
jgi:hypothetical protein